MRTTNWLYTSHQTSMEGMRRVGIRSMPWELRWYVVVTSKRKKMLKNKVKRTVPTLQWALRLFMYYQNTRGWYEIRLNGIIISIPPFIWVGSKKLNSSYQNPYLLSLWYMGSCRWKKWSKIARNCPKMKLKLSEYTCFTAPDIAFRCSDSTSLGYSWWGK